MEKEIHIFNSTRDVIIFCIALAVLFTAFGFEIKQYLRSEQVREMVIASYELDQATARNQQIQLETKRLEAMRPVVESIYGNKNAAAKRDEKSGDG